MKNIYHFKKKHDKSECNLLTIKNSYHPYLFLWIEKKKRKTIILSFFPTKQSNTILICIVRLFLILPSPFFS